MFSLLRQRWQGPGGFAEVIRLALPLVISTSAHTLQLFIDRVFLMQFSPDAMSAAMQAGITHFTIVALFFGIASYVNTFVAQYLGAERPWRVGAAVWQGLYISLFGGIAMLALIPASSWLFDEFEHGPAIRAFEITYFNYMCYAALPMLVSVAISAFYTARRKTTIVMYVNIIAAAVNIILDYLLIFGHFGFPQWGLIGAARATLIATIVSAAIYLVLFFRTDERKTFKTATGIKPEWNLFSRMIRYGLPNGVQIFFEVLPFTLFLMYIGRLSETALSASVIAFQINMLAFLPMIGFGIAVTTLVGQALGQNNPALACRTTWSAASLTIVYMVLIAVGFVLFPDAFLYAFTDQDHPEQMAALRPVVVNLLYFIAFYCLFDTGNIIFSATLKGAGDTRFVMFTSILLNWSILIIPSHVAWRMGCNLYVFWTFATLYVCALAIAYFWRYLSGKWQSMRVIESAPLSIPVVVPEVPTIEPEIPGTDRDVITENDLKEPG